MTTPARPGKYEIVEVDEAVKITRYVYGVRAVRNELKIGQPDYSSSGSGG